ncbi:MAG: hypothetical protein WA441_05165 [Methyloceanibacter sp.]
MKPIQEPPPENNPKSLAAFYRSLPFPTDGELRWLLNQGIDGEVMASPYAIRGAAVEFDRHTFDFDPDGSRAVIFRADDRGEPRDLVAWGPKSGRLASWRGSAFCVGDADDVLNPAINFMDGALRIHRTPLEWLRSGRDGIVIVQPKDVCGHLHDGMRVVCTDLQLSQQVREWLRAPARKIEILVEGVNVEQKGRRAA